MQNGHVLGRNHGHLCMSGSNGPRVVIHIAKNRSGNRFPFNSRATRLVKYTNGKKLFFVKTPELPSNFVSVGAIKNFVGLVITLFGFSYDDSSTGDGP